MRVRESLHTHIPATIMNSAIVRTVSNTARQPVVGIGDAYGSIVGMRTDDVIPGPAVPVQLFAI